MKIKERKPDRLEKGIRFGCGAMFGVLIGFYLLLEFFDFESPGLILSSSFFGCGFLAMVLGDRFWYGLGGGGRFFGP